MKIHHFRKKLHFHYQTNRNNSCNENNDINKGENDYEKTFNPDDIIHYLALGEVALKDAQETIEDNIPIYEAFGAKVDAAGENITDAEGNVVTSLDDLQKAGAITSDQLAALKAFQNNSYNDIAKENENLKEFSGTIGEFAQALADTSIIVDDFSDALDRYRVNSYGEKLEDMAASKFSQGKDERNAAYSSNASREAVKGLMADLNASKLSDDEKFQLMDKINWNLPIEDIMANIQKAIDNGNINNAFFDGTGIEDDSAHKTDVLEKYKIEVEE